MRIHRPFFFSGWLYPEAIFRIKTTEKELLLTFDDGPDPGSTPGVLNILKRYDVKAVFFCLGESAEKYPSLISDIRSAGHITGNHGYSHFDGWVTPPGKYTDNVIKAAPLTSGNLFRPPYGHLRLKQYTSLKSVYKIMFWDVMPYDFKDTSGGKEPLRVLKKMIRPGSVIALHDKRSSTVLSFLDEFIEYTTRESYRFILA